MIRRPPRSTQSRSSAASDVYKRQDCWWPRSEKIQDFPKGVGHQSSNFGLGPPGPEVLKRPADSAAVIRPWTMSNTQTTILIETSRFRVAEVPSDSSTREASEIVLALS